MLCIIIILMFKFSFQHDRFFTLVSMSFIFQQRFRLELVQLALLYPLFVYNLRLCDSWWCCLGFSPTREFLVFNSRDFWVAVTTACDPSLFWAFFIIKKFSLWGSAVRSFVKVFLFGVFLWCCLNCSLKHRCFVARLIFHFRWFNSSFFHKKISVKLFLIVTKTCLKSQQHFFIIVLPIFATSRVD